MTATRQAPAPTVDPLNPKILRWPDIGLTLILDFISEAEEAAMIEAFHGRDPLTNASDQRNGRRRISQHYGYHFDYTTFGASETHFTPVPPYIEAILPRLPVQDCLPDQFTVQYYPPGSGIPPHVDTHSLFAEPLYSLSFGSAVPMQFRPVGPNDARKMRLPKRSLQAAQAQEEEDEAHNNSRERSAKTTTTATSTPTTTATATPAPAPKRASNDDDKGEEQQAAWDLLLPPRSLLLMTGASRYGYTHAIRPRKTDVAADGATVVPRRDRYSVTMRKVRRGAEVGCACAYPGK
ncbi:80ede754-d535-457b-8c1d-3add3071dc4a [Thermothielavioides terrestris]|uniref:80ede754-d535-457b-8c1d-3add3071dc4a n=1 Tax=Thermothielavioides terrestris TaxID=2587410 RepID=A0A446BED1_9PEZI|nr:80ede754-d535-457b-8c1d-3add3071dc4a [Thermothielavioides terrestris]